MTEKRYEADFPCAEDILDQTAKWYGAAFATTSTSRLKTLDSDCCD